MKMIGLLCILCLVVFSGCTTQPPKEKITEYLQLAEKRIATTTGNLSSNDKFAKAFEIQPELLFYNTTEDMVYAVVTGKAEAALVDEVTARIYTQHNDALTTLPPFGNIDWSFITSHENTHLLNTFNPIIRRLKDDGTIERLEEKWSQADTGTVALEPVEWTGEKGVLRTAVAGTFPGYCFYQNGELVGSDIDVLRLIASELGYTLEFISVAEDSFILAVAAGKVDLCAVDMSASSEREEQVSFFEPIYTDGLTVLVLR